MAGREVAARGKDALAALAKDGAQLVPVELALFRASSAIGYVTIGLEAYVRLRTVPRRELGPDLRILSAVFSRMEPHRYLQCQRLRTALRVEVCAALGRVDVLALPATGRTAPRFDDGEIRDGIVDPALLDSVCAFNFLGNLTGLPAASAPVGRDAAGLPVGLQIVGDAWDEACVLQVLAHLERAGVARAERPPVHVDLLAPIA